MNIEMLNQYVKANSLPISITSSSSVVPQLISNTSTDAIFSSRENASQTYISQIQFHNNTIKTTCSCAYPSAGICKHAVAAMNSLITRLTTGEIEMLGFTQASLIQLSVHQIRLPDGFITDLIIHNCGLPAQYQYYPVMIKSVEKNHVVTQSYGNGNNQQEFTYDGKTQILDTNCSCYQKDQMCGHIGFALKHIATTFGYNFFSATYMEEKIKDHLQKYGMTPKDDYEKIFSFELGTTGLKITPKFNNIQPLASEILPFLMDEKAETLSSIPYLEYKNSLTGLGFCFKFNNKSFVGLVPFEGKYNRSKTDFASSLVAIDYKNINYGLSSFEDKEEQDLMIKALQINDLLKTYKERNNIIKLKRAIHYFSDMLPLLQTRLLYDYDERINLVRKNVRPVVIGDDRISLFFTLTESEFFYTLQAKISVNDIVYNINDYQVTVSPLFILVGRIIYPITVPEISFYLSHFTANPETSYFKRDFKTVYKNVLLPLSKKFEIQSSIFQKDEVATDESGLEKHIYISDLEGQYVVFKPAVQYPNQLVPVYSNEMLIGDTEVKNESRSIIYKERNASF